MHEVFLKGRTTNDPPPQVCIRGVCYSCKFEQIRLNVLLVQCLFS